MDPLYRSPSQPLAEGATTESSSARHGSNLLYLDFQILDQLTPNQTISVIQSTTAPHDREL